MRNRNPERPTERRLERYREADRWPVEECLAAMLENQMHAFAAMREALPALARAARAASARLRPGKGRIVYTGAGSSGRIAVQDGVELWPTFSWPRERVAFLLAGGEAALTRSIEGAEDDEDAGRRQVADLALATEDVHIAVAASGTTPFVRAAQAEARRRGALTVALAGNPGSPLLEAAEIPVLLETGPEFLAGSTRMTAGTAQKIALNLLSTQIMICLGRVYEGRMVALVPANAKLEQRARRMVAELAGVGPQTAADALVRSGGDVRRAVLILDGLSPEEAARRLEEAEGDLRRARGR